MMPEKSCAFQPGGARDQTALGLIAAALDDLDASVRVARRGDTARGKESLLLKPVKGIGDAASAQNIVRLQRGPSAHRVAELVVKLKQGDALRPQPPQALREAALDRAGDVAHVIELDPHLGGNLRRRRKRCKAAPDRLLGSAGAVERRGIDPVDAGGNRALEDGLLGSFVGRDQNTAGHAGAKRDLGDFQAGAAKRIGFHGHHFIAQFTMRWHTLGC